MDAVAPSQSKCSAKEDFVEEVFVTALHKIDGGLFTITKVDPTNIAWKRGYVVREIYATNDYPEQPQREMRFYTFAAGRVPNEKITRLSRCYFRRKVQIDRNIYSILLVGKHLAEAVRDLRLKDYISPNARAYIESNCVPYDPLAPVPLPTVPPPTVPAAVDANQPARAKVAQVVAAPLKAALRGKDAGAVEYVDDSDESSDSDRGKGSEDDAIYDH